MQHAYAGQLAWNRWTDILFRTRGSTLPKRTELILLLGILGVWLAVVLFTVGHHEFWRDEVRPLSYAREASSLNDLRLILENDGHPMLWHTLLYAASKITSSSLILPAISIAIAFTSIVIFMFFSPFPLFIRVSFSFSSLPLYEYSVSARNYGITMLLLFLIVTCFHRKFLQFSLFCVLIILLSNTNIHSIIFSLLLSVLYIYYNIIDQDVIRIRGSSLYSISIISIVFLAGAFLALWVCLPNEQSAIRAPSTIDLSALLGALGDCLLSPATEFSDLIRPIPIVLQNIILIALILGLIRRPPLFIAGLVATLALGVFSKIFYPLYFRHQGLLLIFIISLYWIDCNLNGNGLAFQPFQLARKAALYGALPSILIVEMAQAAYLHQKDIQYELSSNKNLAEFIKKNDLDDAIIMGEPDLYIESLPYYANNKIYIPREDRYRKYSYYTLSNRKNFTLGDLLTIASKIHKGTGKTVLIALGHFDVFNHESGEVHFGSSAGRTFSWTRDERESFLHATREVARFERATTNEKYRLFLLEPDPATTH